MTTKLEKYSLKQYWTNKTLGITKIGIMGIAYGKKKL